MTNKVLWLTGLSGSGKTTLSNSVKKKLIKQKFRVKLVDGDSFRKKNKNKNKFTKKNIYLNNLSIIDYVYRKIEKYDFIIVSVISPLRKSRLRAKKIFKKKYYEVFVKCSKRELIKRDTKNLYKLALQKKINNLIGFNSKIKYELSRYKKLVINSELETISHSTKKILNYILDNEKI